MPPNLVEASQKGKPWPGYFVVRNTGEIVPLIAIDELPPGTNIAGVPRSIELEDTIGMLNLGLQRGCGSYYQITSGKETRAEGCCKAVKATDHQSTKRPDSPQSPAPPATPPNSPSRSIALPSITNVPITPNRGNTVGTSQTQLCRHWCHHGICKWGQQCRYRHSMPMTSHGLQEVGLADWPAWYRSLNPGYFVSEAQSLKAGIGNGRRGGRGCSVQVIGVTANAKINAGKPEKLRAGSRTVFRERSTGRVLRSEELGEQIITRLKGMEKEGKGKGQVGEEGVSGSLLIERASARDTRNWEDESESDEEDEGEDEGEEDGEEAREEVNTQGKLVDIYE